MLTKQDLRQIEDIVDQKLEEKLEEKLANFPTKDVVYNMLDEIYKIVKKNSDEADAMRFRLQDHEERISLLEKVTSSLAAA